MTTQTHQPVAYQIEDANGEFMCLNRTKSTIRGIASKPLYAESALEKERTSRIEAQQRLADMQELAAKSGLAHRMAVQRCVQAAVAEAVAAEREACAALVAEWNTAMTDKLAASIRARGTPRHNNGEHDAI